MNRAIAREKEIRGWLRARKVGLVEAGNPSWLDLSVGWDGEQMDSSLRPE